MQSHKGAFATLVSVFFFWGFVAASNDILIPVFREKLHLQQWQSQMISVAFYVAYTAGSIIYLALSRYFREDVLNRLGYRNGIALGLCISAAGTLLFYPAASLVSFPLMITGLFIVALGFSLQQTAANPMAIVIGAPERASQRLSLAGGVNNIGTTICPLVVSYAIFGNSDAPRALSIESVKTPYLILGAAFLLVALLFKFSSLPQKMHNEAETTGPRESLLKKFPQLSYGMIAIFVYVGVEVSTASNLPEYMRQHADIPTAGVSPYISLFWASLMIGRWTSSASAITTGGNVRHLLRVLMPYLAFGLFVIVNRIAGNDTSIFYPYMGVMVVMIIAEALSMGHPGRQLMIFSACGIIALITGMATSGLVSVYAFISVGLFCSTLWPCIFTLGIAGLGRHTNQGSSYLIMMIMGGGLISALQGWLADTAIGIRFSYLVGVACFAYLAWYGYRTKVMLGKQGITVRGAASAH